VLPVLTLSFGYASVMMRFFRTSLLDNLALDFVRTARAKGLGPPAVIGRHVLRNALIPILTVLGVEMGRLLGGAVLTETIFALPGLGRLAVDSVLSRDFPTMQAAVMVMALAVLGSNLLVDVLYGIVDPRLRVQS
jgi:peptide/nickel transport system permease protein